jgi:flagellar hook-associated protein FlgK
MGAANDVYSFQVVGSGTVGVTAGLSLEVRDGGGTLLTTLNIGAGYTPDAPLNVGNGITVSLSAGTTNNGSFSARMIAQPDTARILPALGLNSFFTGVSAATIAVRPELVADPTLLSASRSGEIGDARNLERFAALREQAVLAGNTLSFEEFSQSVSGAIGDEVRSLDLRRLSSETLLQGLVQQEQSIIGVDINEEMVKLLEFERLVEAGAKYLSVVNSAMDDLLNIIK